MAMALLTDMVMKSAMGMDTAVVAMGKRMDMGTQLKGMAEVDMPRSRFCTINISTPTITNIGMITPTSTTTTTAISTDIVITTSTGTSMVINMAMVINTGTVTSMDTRTNMDTSMGTSIMDTATMGSSVMDMALGVDGMDSAAPAGVTSTLVLDMDIKDMGMAMAMGRRDTGDRVLAEMCNFSYYYTSAQPFSMIS
jgi:hypothetical protein